MNLIENECAKIQAGFYCLFLNLSFEGMDSEVRRAFSKQAYSRILRALREPVELSETSAAFLDMYEDHVSFTFTAHSGQFAEC